MKVNTITSARLSRSPVMVSENRMHKYIIDQITGKFGSGIGEFWFKFIGYVLIVSLFHAANDLSSSLVIAATK